MTCSQHCWNNILFILYRFWKWIFYLAYESQPNEVIGSPNEMISSPNEVIDSPNDCKNDCNQIIQNCRHYGTDFIFCPAGKKNLTAIVFGREFKGFPPTAP